MSDQLPYQSQSVLVVDDEPEVREALALLLRREGYTVSTATDGQNALSRLHSGAMPSLILLDVMMPNMDGFEFRSRQLQDPALATIPVIAYSGHPEAVSNRRRLRAACLRKPLDVDGLLRMVASFCHRN